MIRLIDLTKVYNKTIAVDHINLEVKTGSIMGFLGPNGAGKTTTIKMIAGILKPTKGRIILNGIDLLKEPEKAKKITGFIPDRPFLYERLTGKEFLEFVSEMYFVENPEKKIDEMLRKFELEDFKDELIESYSHGMKQRIAFCAALIHDPEILIVDEPTVGLDPKGIRMIKDVFKGLAKRGKTIFVSTHSLSFAEEIADEVAIINSGKLIAKGTLDQLKKKAGIDGDLENVFLKLTHEDLSSYQTKDSFF